MDERYLTYIGRGGKKLLHLEHWSNPDAETYLTGIDYYNHPKLCREKLKERYPMLGLPVPKTDDPIPKPKLGAEISSDPENHTVRWGAGTTGTFVHGEAFFNDAEEVFRFSPLEHADFTGWPHVVENLDYSSEEVLYERFRANYPSGTDKAQESSSSSAGFYNTMFMWPILVFGWEMFLCCCLDPKFERIMDEFAELNRRVFRVLSKLPVNFITCHDDISTTKGPVCSPNWMHKYIYPRYDEYFGMLKAAGKEVLFMVDGNADAHVESIFNAGARGIISEPYTDYKAIARKYENCFIAGEGDTRILMRNDPVEIKKMVQTMAETARMSGGYMMCIGNHIPWNVPGEAVKYYMEFSRQFAVR